VISEVKLKKVKGGLVTAFEGSAEIDLVPLTGGISELLAALDVPEGSYKEIRMMVSAGQVTLKPDAKVAHDSHTFTMDNGGLKFPGKKADIRVKLDQPLEVATGLSTDVVLDFDLARNFHFKGSPKKKPGVKCVTFTPCVRATNATASGRIALDAVSDAGTDDPTDDTLISGAKVDVLDESGASVGGGVADGFGHAEVILTPGVYSVVVSAEAHENLTVSEVIVVRGNVTDLGALTLMSTDASEPDSEAPSLSGTVLSDAGTSDTGDDVALAGAVVIVVPSAGGDPVAVEVTDADGHWSAQGLEEIAYDVIISEGAHVGHVEGGVTAAPGGTTVDVTLALIP
jgi:hypothetical protein